MEVAVPGGGAGAVMATDAFADLVASATLVAVTVKFPAVVPATYNPVEEIVPPVALHVTDVLEEPVTLAENCCDAPSARGADFGLIATLTEEEDGFCEGDPLELLVEPPHPERTKSKKSRETDPITCSERMLASVFASRPEVVDKTQLRRGMVWTPHNRLTEGEAVQNCPDVQIWRRVRPCSTSGALSVSACQRREGSARYAWWSWTVGPRERPAPGIPRRS